MRSEIGARLLTTRGRHEHRACVPCPSRFACFRPGGERGHVDVRAQTERVLKNLSAVLEAAGTSFDRAVKTTVFLKNISDFAAMNEVYAKFFHGNPPARSTVQAVLPNEAALVEIDVVALQ